jgi:hypothetical protein
MPAIRKNVIISTGGDDGPGDAEERTDRERGARQRRQLGLGESERRTNKTADDAADGDGAEEETTGSGEFALEHGGELLLELMA